MNQFFRKAAAIIALAIPAGAYAQDSIRVVNKETMVNQLTELFDHMEAKKLFNGNAMISLDDKALFTRSVGLGNRKTNEPLTAASVFELASVSKQFTAAGILRLVDKKKITLDQQVTTILPALPYKGITIRMLLNHTSGLPDYMELFGEHWDSTKIATNKDIVPMLVKYKPAILFAPGAEWKYSNTGYALLATIIEKVSGKSYADFMKEELFRPLKMNETFVYSRRLTPKNIPHYALGYILNEQGNYMLPDEVSRYNPIYFLDGIQGDGTVNTTTGDMLKWNNAVAHRTLLSASSWEQALTPVVLKDGKPGTYGFGWGIGSGPKSGNVISHSGSWPGYVTYNLIYLDKHISFVLLTNMEQPGDIFNETVRAIKNIILGLPYTAPQPFEKKKEATIDKSVYSSYTGTYNLAPGFDIVVTTSDGHLYIEPTGQGKSEILPESATMYFIPDFPVNIEFKQKEGKAESLVLYQNGQQMPAPRVK